MATSTRKITIKNSTLLMAFILVPFFVDQFQGYLTLVAMVNIPVSLLTKAVMILIMVGYLMIKNKIYELLIIASLIMILLFSLLTDVYNLTFIVADIRLIIKLVFFPLSLYFFITVLESSSRDYLYSVMRFLFYALFVAMVLSVFGIGLSQYGVSSTNISIGYSGYFFAGNELAPLAVLFYSYNLFYHLYNESSVFKLSTVFFIGFISCFLVMTKVSIGGFFVCTLMIPIFMNLSQNLLKWKKVTLLYYSNLMIAGLAIVSVVAIIFFDMILAYYSRLSVAYNRAGNILGARQDWAQLGYDLWIEKYSLLQQLVGGGTYYRSILLGNNETKSVEIDPLDIMLSNGLIGLAAIYGFWLFYLLYFLKLSFETKDRSYGIAIFLLVFTLSVSFTSGHLMGSSIVGFYLALVLAHTLLKKNKKIEEKLVQQKTEPQFLCRDHS